MNNFSKAKVLCIGDLILDCYALGGVEKISPEAPIPILKFSIDFITVEHYSTSGFFNNKEKNARSGITFGFLETAINPLKPIINIIGIIIIKEIIKLFLSTL